MKKHQNPDGTWNGIGLISEIADSAPQEIKEIWNQVKANYHKLDNCSLHDFSEIANPDDHSYQRKYRCKHCGGTVSPNEKTWYELGRQHGGLK